MASNKHELKIATFDDGTCAVLRVDPAKPRFIEIIATFYDATHARNYVRLQESPSDERREERRPVIRQAAKGKPKPAVAANSKSASAAKPRQAVAAQPRRAPAAKPKIAATDISDRQMAVLKALRSRMDKKRRVEATGAELAKASSIPLGSLHSTLASLEKKRMIRTERQGSAQLRAVYEVLESAQKSTRSANAAANGKVVPAVARAH
jgi:DNA-binding MarR family transcriptional regulator